MPENFENTVTVDPNARTEAPKINKETNINTTAEEAFKKAEKNTKKDVTDTITAGVKGFRIFD